MWRYVASKGLQLAGIIDDATTPYLPYLFTDLFRKIKK